MKGKELFGLLCKEISADPKEVGRFEVQVKANGQVWITGYAGGKPSDRYYDWALWGSGDWKSSVKTLKTQEALAILSKNIDFGIDLGTGRER